MKDNINLIHNLPKNNPRPLLVKTISEYFSSLPEQLYQIISQNIVNKFYDNKYKANSPLLINLLKCYSKKEEQTIRHSFSSWRNKINYNITETNFYHQTDNEEDNASSMNQAMLFNFYTGQSTYSGNFYKQNYTSRDKQHNNRKRNHSKPFYNNSINSSKQRHHSYSQMHAVDNFLQRQEQYNISKSKNKQKLLQNNEDEYNRRCTFSPNISYSTKSLGNSGNSFEMSKSAYMRLYEDSTQRKLNYEKKVNDYIKNLKSEANQTRTSNGSKVIDKNKIEKLYNDYKLQKTKRQMLMNQIDNETGMTFKPHVNSSPQYTKKINMNIQNRAKKLMQQNNQKKMVKNYYNYDFLQDF